MIICRHPDIEPRDTKLAVGLSIAVIAVIAVLYRRRVEPKEGWRGSLSVKVLEGGWDFGVCIEETW